MKPFGIAGIQMNLHHGNNVDAIEARINVLMSLYPWVEMVLISELAAHGPLHNYAETMPGTTEQRFCDIAQKHNIWLIPGSFFELRNNAIYNTAPVINPQGEVIARHRKLFPFLPFEEGIEAGDEFIIFDVPNAGRFGLCICYDMWFPEVLRTLTSMGAEVILHPVLTGTNDRDIELNLARSSGALFQSYIIDINGLGVGGVGKSCLIDPAGRVIHQSGESEEYLVAELDFDLVRRQREVGLRGLGQPLKSFRDSKINFTVYNQTLEQHNYLESLGPMQKPSKLDKTKKAIEPSLLTVPPIENSLNDTLLVEQTTVIDTSSQNDLSAEIPLQTVVDLSKEEIKLDGDNENNKSGPSQVPVPVPLNESKEINVKVEQEELTTANSGWIKDTATQLKKFIKS